MKKWTLLFLAATCWVLPGESIAELRGYQVYTRVSGEYDDNIRETENDTTSSFKIIAELEFVANLSLESALISLRYKPSVTWWDNRDEDDVDLYHDFDVFFFNRFSERVSLNARNKFRYAQLPEAIEGGSVVRQQSDFLYNETVAGLMFQLTPVNRADISSEYRFLRYDEAAVADRSDYDMLEFGAGYRHNLLPETSVGIVAGLEVYDSADKIFDRSADTFSFGGVADHMFSPNVQIGLGFGYMTRDYDAAGLSSDSSPYGDVRLTLSPSPATRIATSAGYSLMEADIFPFVSRERLALSLGVSHDLTARVTVGAQVVYARSDYKANNVEDLVLASGQLLEIRDGSEDSIQASLRASYQMTASHWVEVAWYMTSLDSDIDSDFDRNRLNLGWRAKF